MKLSELGSALPFRSRFSRNAVVMITGTVIAQGIPLAISPILTRMFSPADFGVLALYMAAMSIASIIATGRYDLAVMLAKDEEDADALVILSFIIAVGLGIVTALIVAVYGVQIGRLLNRPDLGVWLYSLPVGLTLTGVYNALAQWFNRHGDYGQLGRNRVTQAVLTGASTIGLGKLGLAFSAMISGALFGLFATTTLLMRQFVKGRAGGLFTKAMLSRSRRLAVIHRRHPLHVMPAQWVGVLAMQMPVFIVATAFGPAAAGFYHFAYRVIAVPGSLVGAAIGDVYRQHASADYRANGEFTGLFRRTVALTFVLGCAPAAVLLLTGPALFAFVFGEEWRVAGEYARMMAVAAFAQFVFLPVDKAALIVGATRYILAWNVMMVLLIGVLAFVTLTYDHSVVFFVGWLTAIITAMYCADAVFEYNFSRGSRMWWPGRRAVDEGEGF